jgi:hypothetical protein
VICIDECNGLAAEPVQWYHAWIGADGEDWLRIGRDEHAYRLQFPGLADFALAADGVRACRRHASPDTFRHLLLDQVLPLVLAHQGWCVLHAAAVVTSAGGAAFLGNAGYGKSTLTASLAATGQAALTDDTLILTVQPGRPVMGHLAYPSIRMWPESAHAIGGAGYRHDGRVSELNDKVRVGPAGGFEFAASDAALRVLYVLTPDPTAGHPYVEEIPPRERVMDVVRHTFVLDWQDTDRLRSGFDAVTRIVDRVAVRRLRFRHDYADLPAVRRAVLDDLCQSDSPGRCGTRTVSTPQDATFPA